MSGPRWLSILAAVLTLLLFTAPSAAHELRPGALALQETAPGRFTVQFAAPPSGLEAAAPEFPAHCLLTGPELDCGSRGLDGSITVRGLDGTLSRVVVYVAFRNGSSTTAVLSADSPSVLVRSRAAGGRESRSRVAGQYTLLGVEHILTGIDHVLFVLGLILLVRFGKRLLVTITAFTLAHSVTLALAVLGFVHVPQAPVEAVIALSILLLAVECAHDRDSLSRQAPWAVAFSFGLLHGFGFAGALAEVGLPEGQVPVALLFFNVGVELGQLGVIASAWLVASAAQHFARKRPLLERALVYGIGTLASYWSIERLLIAFGRA
ncbi:MAG TPA: HupE/UreJ family protein [Polyangiaceae bacterium]|nr:HupE/UreJ family protein [Polyangiaceae bacterium]